MVKHEQHHVSLLCAPEQVNAQQRSLLEIEGAMRFLDQVSVDGLIVPSRGDVLFDQRAGPVAYELHRLAFNLAEGRTQRSVTLSQREKRVTQRTRVKRSGDTQ